MLDNLEDVIESILFVAGEAVDISDICSKIDVTKSEVRAAANKLQNRYDKNNGMQIQIFNNKLQLSSNPIYSEYVSAVLNPIRQRNLSKATLETAAIVAYKQPVTRLEIEEIRGVGSDYAINILLEHGLIEVVGKKDAVGRPSLFGTTDEFLKRFNISSIDELPDYNDLLEKVKVIRSSDDRLYNHFEIDESSNNLEKKLNLAVSKIDSREDVDVLQKNETEDANENNSLADGYQDDGNDYFKDESEPNDYFKFKEEDIMTANEFVDADDCFEDDDLL